MLLPQHQVELLQPFAGRGRKSGYRHSLRVDLASFLPDQLQGQVLVRPATPGESATSPAPDACAKRRAPTAAETAPARSGWSPQSSARPRTPAAWAAGHVFMDGALGNGTTAGDLMLAQSEEWSRRTSFNLRMVSLFCGNWFSTTSGVQFPRLPCAAVPIRCRSAFRTTTVKLIGISSEH